MHHTPQQARTDLLVLVSCLLLFLGAAQLLPSKGQGEDAMLQFRYNTGTSGTPIAFPANQPATITAKLSDGTADDQTTFEEVIDTRVPSYPSALAALVAVGWNDNPLITLSGYRLTCKTVGEMQHITGAATADRVSEVAVWAFEGTTWTAVRTHTTSQDGAFHTVTGDVPYGTKRIGVVVTSYVSGGASSNGTPAYHRATVQVSDFRLLYPPCAIPPPPRLTRSVFLVNGVGTILVKGNQ